jgi:hypothetical protein
MYTSHLQCRQLLSCRRALQAAANKAIQMDKPVEKVD